MTFVETVSTVRARTARPRSRRYGSATVVLLAVTVLSILTGSAAADPISDAQAQANQLVAQIAHMGTRIHQLTESYAQASHRAELAAAHVEQDRAKLDDTQRDVDGARALLREQAVNAYLHSPPGSASSRGTTGNPADDLLVAREYLAVATGGVSQTIDRLRVDLATLRVWTDTLRTEQRNLARAATQVLEARRAALAEAAKEESALGQVRGRLAGLIAQAQAARAAAAAANAAAARQAAAAAAREMAARSATVAAAARVTPVTAQGLPVSGGLISAVSAAVSAPAPSRGPSAPPAPPAPAAPPPAPAPAPAGGGGGGAGGVWAALRQCESSGNYAANTGNGFYGAYQFSQSTWSGLGFPGRPDLEPPAMQDQAAQKLQAMDGWAPWPACAAALGLL